MGEGLSEPACSLCSKKDTRNGERERDCEFAVVSNVRFWEDLGVEVRICVEKEGVERSGVGFGTGGD